MPQDIHICHRYHLVIMLNFYVSVFGVAMDLNKIAIGLHDIKYYWLH